MAVKTKCRVDGCDNLTAGVEGYCNKHRDLSISRRYQRMKKDAHRRGIPVSLTLYQYEKIIELKACSYCGGKLPVIGYGLDRVDSSIGYVKENVVACCYKCNTLKGDRFTHSQAKILIDFIQLMEQNNWLKPEGEGDK